MTDGREGDRRSELVLLLELMILATLMALTYHELRDPEPALSRFLGGLPSQRFPHLRPFLALLRGLGNLAALLAVIAFFSRARWSNWLRTAVAGWIVLAWLAWPVLAQVELRLHVDEAPGNQAPYRSMTHDGGVLQAEMASTALLKGENPYRASYAKPPMSRAKDSDPAGWRSIGYQQNPAFEHLPYPPGNIIISAPIQWLAQATLGFYDQRILYLVAAIALAVILARLCPKGAPRRIVVLLVLLSPLVRGYLIVGRNDVLLLVPLALFGTALYRQRWRTAAAWLGVALTMKQFALFVLPFFFVLAYMQGGRNISTVLRRTWPALAIPVAVILPFLAWDASALVEDLLLWNLGAGADAYPVRWDGFGLTPLAYGLDLVQSPSGPNPHGWLLLPSVVLGTAGLGAWVARGATPFRALVASGVLVYLALFASRFFADNYLAVPAVLWCVAWLAERTHDQSDRFLAHSRADH
ncbi:MAG: DUF2029 domain-containing protein [Deltaproteobacteria bacterium]|nr:DUF2029 domain-containing protein [Deltaproteobacteria bacterium]